MTVTIQHDDRELEVTGTYTPEEPMVMYYSDGSGYPGAPAEFEINEIECEGEDVYDEYEDDIETIEEKALEQIQGY